MAAAIFVQLRQQSFESIYSLFLEFDYGVFQDS